MTASIPGQRTVAATRPPNVAPERLVAVLVLAYFDVLAGRRPYSQIASLFSPAAHLRLAPSLARERGHDRYEPTKITRIIMQAPHENAREACVLVQRANRTTAMTVRLERHQGLWRVAELASPDMQAGALRTAGCPTRVRDAFDTAADDDAGLIRRDSA
jgi:hypothetical protein